MPTRNRISSLLLFTFMLVQTNVVAVAASALPPSIPGSTIPDGTTTGTIPGTIPGSIPGTIPGTIPSTTPLIFTGIDIGSFSNSIGTLIRSGSNFVLFGSHHRILLDNGLTEQGSGFWANGDYARHNPNTTRSTTGEFGFYKDVANDIRLGSGIGFNHAYQTLLLNGKGRLNSRYVVIEGDFAIPATGWIGSITAYVSTYSATISRGYTSGTTNVISTGQANGSAWAVRLRSDWNNVGKLGGLDVSPYLAYTHVNSTLDAYTETGGTLPLSFARQKQVSREVRGGATLLSRYSDQTDLRFPLELVHRKNGSSTVSGTTSGFGFSIDNPSSKQNWGRTGIEVDHRTSPQALLNGAVIIASEGGDSSWLATISYKQAF